LYAMPGQSRSYSLWYLDWVNLSDPTRLKHSVRDSYYHRHAGYTVDPDKPHPLQSCSFDWQDAEHRHTTFLRPVFLVRQWHRNDWGSARAKIQFVPKRFGFYHPNHDGNF